MFAPLKRTLARVQISSLLLSLLGTGFAAMQPIPALAGGSADLSIVHTGPQTVVPGQRAAYLVHVSNAGPDDAQNVWAIDYPYPQDGITFNAAESDPSCLAIDDPVHRMVIVCTLPSLAAGETRSLNVVFDTDRSLPCEGELGNWAFVSAQEPGDPNKENNESKTSARFSCAESRLLLRQLSAGVTDTAVLNQRNINLLAFEARAEQNPLLLTAISAEAAVGSLTVLQNYALWADLVGDDGVVETVLERGVSPQSGRVRFARLTGGGLTVPLGRTIRMEVHADVAGFLFADRVQLRFSDNAAEAEDLATGVQLVGVERDGVCPISACQILLTTASGTLWRIVPQGDLYVTRRPIAHRNHQLLGGTLGETVLDLSFRAETEDIDVTEVQLTLSGTTTRSIDSLELYREGSPTLFARATIGGCGSARVPPNTFCAHMQSGQLVIPKGLAAAVLVRPRIKSDRDGGFSGDPALFFVHPDPEINRLTGRGAVKARGGVSGNNLMGNNGNDTADGEVFIGRDRPAPTNLIINGQQNVVTMAKIAAITNANPAPDGTAVPVAPGTQLGIFRFLAAPHTNDRDGLNKTVVDALIFTVRADNVLMDADDFSFLNTTSSTALSDCIAERDGRLLTGPVTGTFSVICSDLQRSPVRVAIDQGTSETFSLRGTVLNPQIRSEPSVLQVSLEQFSDIRLQGSFGAHLSHIDWIDQDLVTSMRYHWVEFPENIVRSTQYRQ